MKFTLILEHSFSWVGNWPACEIFEFKNGNNLDKFGVFVYLED